VLWWNVTRSIVFSVFSKSWDMKQRKYREN